MKHFFTLALAIIFTSQNALAQDAGFYPPEGSTFNEDSTVITLPDAYLGEMYNETIQFYSTDEIELEGVDVPVNFVSVTITGIGTPEGLTTTCAPEDCMFLPNQWGEATMAGIATTEGSFTLDFTADVVVSATIFGFTQEIPFSIPYTGGNPTIDFLVDDYSVLNEFIPTFILNVMPSTVSIEEAKPLSEVNLSPNPAKDHVVFNYNAFGEQVELELYDMLGNLISRHKSNESSMYLNTSVYPNGLYVYRLSTSTTQSIGRLVVNH